MLAELITIGNELLSGKTTDTNAAWLGRKLNLLGIKVTRITSVQDTKQDILEILEETSTRSDLIILSGGLGPTSDDVTKPALCEFFNTGLIFSPEIFSHIESLLEKRNCPVNEYNRRQAEVPESAIILFNDEGTAPGLLFKKESRIYISLPGVPFELKTLFEERVVPELKAYFALPFIHSRTVLTQGSFEANLAELLKDFEAELPPDVSISYLPSPGIIKLHLRTTGNDPMLLGKNIDNQILKLQKIIPEYITGFDDDTLEKVIGKILGRGSYTLSVAESCTGGAIASLITSVPGSSGYFKGGIVAYSNEIKRDQLAIDKFLIDKYGAVSKQVVEDMATNVRLLFNSTYSIAISGIAGPSGGTNEKPVGTIWIAVSGMGSLVSSKFRFGDNRQRNIARASATALNMLRKLMLDKGSDVNYN